MMTLHHVERIMRRQLEDVGLPTGKWMAGARRSEDGQRMEAVFNTHPACGTGESRLMHPDDPSGAESMIARHVIELGRLLMRDHDIQLFGGDPLDPPAWSHLAHPLGLHILDAIGIQRENCGRYAQPAGSSMLSGNEARLFSLSDNQWDLRCVIRASHAKILRIEGRGIEFRDNGPSATLIVDTVLPEIAATAAAGRDLADLVQHPALDGATEPILRAQMSKCGRRTEFTLQQRHIPVEKPPAGCSLTWQRVDLHRR